ncbi:MAG TPA: hypothetical protein VN611_12445, partial [Patescibacteria group bacterium]|nr:hypothetical protein [Patescibacteria group bacterium]
LSFWMKIESVNFESIGCWVSPHLDLVVCGIFKAVAAAGSIQSDGEEADSDKTRRKINKIITGNGKPSL